MQELVEDDLVLQAVGWAQDLAAGRRRAPVIERGPLEVPRLEDVDIGHRSRAVDEVLQRVILDGARVSLEEGLEIEIRGFGEVSQLADMRIGVDHFIQKGPRSKAPFVHS